MALTKFTDNVEIIQALSNTPNATEGLTADQLKAKFDDAANKIKTYLNDTLTEEIDVIDTAVSDLDTAKIDKTAVVDSLTSISATDPLSANQGKILNESKIPNDGWSSANETYSYVSWDPATKTGVVGTNQDATSLLSVGMKVKFTQNATVKYGIIVAISSTQITLFMGTDYTLTNEVITNAYYSTVENPYGFPGSLVNPTNASLKSKIIVITRDGQGANGDVSYTGVGFKPTSVKALMVVPGTLYKSNGFADSAGTSHCQYTSSANTERLVDWLIVYSNQTAWVQHGKVKTYDNDGLTLTWEKIGTPSAGTMDIVLLCER